MAERGDIRVRLTPEGVADVVRALRQVQKEATDAGRQSSEVIKNLRQEFRQLLPALGFAAAVTGFAALVKGAADFADRMDDASQRTGDSVEDLSALAFQARFSSVSFEELEATLARTARAVQEFRNGSIQQTEAFRDLNISVAEFEGLGASRSFALISERLLQVEDATQRAALAQDLFGRSGAKLLTLVQDLGEKGFAAVAQEAEAAGAIISTDLALAASAANDSLDSMQVLVQGLALQFVSGFAPQVNTALTQFREDVQGKGVKPMREFGDRAGQVFRVIVAGLTLIGSAAGSALNIIGRFFGALAAAGGAALTGNFSGAADVFRQFAEDARSEFTDAFEAVDRNLERLREAASEKPLEIKVRTSIDREAVNETAADAQQQIQKRLQDLQKRVGDADLKAAQDAIKRRRELAEESLKVDEARAQAALALQQNTLQGQRAQAAIEGQILAERTRIIQRAFQDELALIQQRAAALSSASQQQFGNTRANAQLQTAIDRQARTEQLQLAQRHFQDLARLQQDYLARYRASAEAIKAIDQEIADNRLQRERTFRDIARSRLSEQEQFNDRIREAEERLADLRAAVLAGDLEKARQLRQEIASLATEIARAQGAGVDSDAGFRIGKRLAEDADGLLELALAQKRQAEKANQLTAQQGARTLTDQLKALSDRIKELEAQQLRPVELRVAVNDDSMRQLFRNIQDRFRRETFSINLQPTLASAGISSPGFASGGPVPGYAPHPRADNVLARLTPGEFVHQVAAVRYYGLDFMRDINARRFPRFADGGLVGSMAAAAANDSPLDEVNINLSIGGERVRMRSDRAEARRLTRILENVGRGVA